LQHTKIEWVKNPDGTQGYTWNPITGCLNGCPYCYARKLANGRLKARYLANKNIAPRKTMAHDVGGQHYEWLDDTPDINPFYPRFWEDRLEQPVVKYRSTKAGYIWKPHKARGIFCCDMSDLFGIGVPEEWTRRVLNIIDYCCQDRFYLLTKQPQNLAKFSPFPDNCFVGVTATDRESFNNAVWHLKDISAKVRYISCEPLLGQTVAGILDNHHNWPVMNGSILQNVIQWVIIGAQTKPYKPPKIEWVQEIVRAADKAGIPVFLKDNLTPITSSEAWAGKWVEHENQPLGEEYWWHPRQEVPSVTPEG